LPGGRGQRSDKALDVSESHRDFADLSGLANKELP
jgi:hypothetical protein